MLEKNYRLVRIGNMQVGLIGLKEIFEGLKNQADRPEADVKSLLVEKVGRKNYIAPSVKQEYEKALFREFRTFLGEKVEEERGGSLEMTILGPGCYSCNKLEQDIMTVLSETGIQAGINHISDPSLMAQYGILPAPSLIINGKVKSSGRVPPKPMIRKWLEEEKP